MSCGQTYFCNLRATSSLTKTELMTFPETFYYLPKNYTT